MSSAFAIAKAEVVSPLGQSPGEKLVKGLRVAALTNNDRDEVLAFLAARPIHTVCMVSYIRDNNIVSPLNRGFFFGCRNDAGQLKGVALIGHATLLETNDDDALQAFAALKHEYTNSHLVRGEHEMIKRFWQHYGEIGNEFRLARRELLYEARIMPVLEDSAPVLQRATIADLDRIMTINAEMILSECGIDPLKKDPVGFRERLVRRVKQGRVWIWMQNGQLIFKADVFAETPEMLYVEGVYVDPFRRGQGHGVSCLAQLTRLLLLRSQAICLLIDQRQSALATFYGKVGFQLRGTYDTVYLKPETN
jgi:predicted GNAT family acetyltransferase